MAICGVGGAHASLLVPLGWVCGRILRKGERLSLVLLDLRWGMEVERNFGMICGAGIRF
jgi:hypothetical protein